jgi:hypothetical protein
MLLLLGTVLPGEKGMVRLLLLLLLPPDTPSSLC